MEKRFKVIDDLNAAKKSVNEICFALAYIKTVDEAMVEASRLQIIQALDDAIEQLPKRFALSNK
jgi:hypothetical protein